MSHIDTNIEYNALKKKSIQKKLSQKYQKEKNKKESEVTVYGKYLFNVK